MQRRVIPVGGGSGLGPAKGGATADQFLIAMARTPYSQGERALSDLSRRAADAAGTAAFAHGEPSTVASAVSHLYLRRGGPPPPALRTALMTAAGSPDAFIAMRRRYAASLAASSVCGWVAGVGDRHLQNILVDLRDGSLVHIDFGYAFGTATAALPIPELVPFRATSALLGVLAPMDARAALSGDMAAAMHALRRGAALLRGVMDVFLREPLIDWQYEAKQVQVKAGRAVKAAAAATGPAAGTGGGGGGGGKGGESMGATAAAAAAVVGRSSGLGSEAGRFVELKIAHAWCKLELANPCHVALAQCAAKHEGQAHWEGMREMVFGTAGAGARDGGGKGGDGGVAAGGVRATAGEVCGSVEEQVECLLDLATDPLVLATAWSGWRPWL